MRTKEIVGAILALTFFLVLAPSVLADDVPGAPFEVGGHVYSDTVTVSGADVTVTNQATGESLTATTDSNGAYVVALGNLPNGHNAGDTIEVTASYSGMSGTSTAPRSANLSDSPQIIDVTIAETVVFAITSGPYAANITIDAVTIKWTTNMPGNSIVNYGLNTSYMDEPESNASLVINHSINLTGLNQGVLYHYNVSSTNVTGTTVYSSDKTFIAVQTEDVNITANDTTIVNSTSGNTIIEIAARQQINGTINITEYEFDVNVSEQVPPNTDAFSVVTGERPVGRYVVIDNSSELNETSISWILLKMCYNESELIEAGLDKNKVGIAWYNDTSYKWEMLKTGDQPWVIEAPIHYPGETCVAANISHFSIFAVAATVLVDDADDVSGAAGAGGSSGAASGEPYDNVAKHETRDQYLYVNREVTYSFVTPELAIYEIVVIANKNTGLITARIELLKDTSTLVDAPPEGTVYKNVNIWLGTYGFATSENIKDAAIRFKVEKSWLTDKLSNNDISLVKWEGGNWIELSTKLLKDDSDYVYYEAHTTSFSPFAIVGKPPVVPTPPPDEPPADEPAADEPAADEPEEPVKEPWWKIPSFILVFVIAGLLAVAYAMMRRRRN